MKGFYLLIFTLIYTFVNLYSQSPDIKYDFIVAKDGSGNFKTVQEAIDSVPDLRNTRTVILIKKGTYKERIVISPLKINLVLIGEDVESTIITYNNHAKVKNRFGEEIGTSGSSGVFLYGHNFIAKNITFENTAGDVAQAVAVRIDGDKVQFINCRFKGFIDTLYPHSEKSRQYYKNCTIAGAVDFIFGWSTAVFDSCKIICLRSGGYITAASTLPENKFGFVFRYCTITGNVEEKSVYLGRPWRPYAKTVFIECFMDKIIHPHGWHNWNKPDCEKTAYYAEYKNYGPGASLNNRVNWSHQLTETQAVEYSLKNIFGDWLPE